MGSYEIGYQLTPLMQGDGLEAEGLPGSPDGPHPPQQDMLYKLCEENRDNGNKMVKEGKYPEAIGRYSEMIMQARALDNESDIIWDEAGEGKAAVVLLRATAYLNLSLCFVKTQQWEHAINTTTRALQGDKDPADPKENVLPPEKKAKALFRRAQVHCEGFGNFERAKSDLNAALLHAPEDKAIQNELKKVEFAIAKTAKKADKKLKGFLQGSKAEASGVSAKEGIFDEALRPNQKEMNPPPSEMVKVREGLYLAPKAEKVHEQSSETNPLEINYDELGAEIKQIREDNPEAYKAMRQKAAELCEKMGLEKLWGPELRPQLGTAVAVVDGQGGEIIAFDDSDEMPFKVQHEDGTCDWYPLNRLCPVGMAGDGGEDGPLSVEALNAAADAVAAERA